MTYITAQPGTDAYDKAVHGYVLANRVNDVVAGTDTKRHQDYFRVIVDQFRGEPALDPKDQYREQAKELLPRAIDAYERKHDVCVDADRIYRKGDIAAVVDGVEDDQIGLTVHIRRTYSSYLDSVNRGVTHDMWRQAQLMMITTALPYWIHLNYFEDVTKRARKLTEHDVRFDIHAARSIEQKVLAFIERAKQRIAA